RGEGLFVDTNRIHRHGQRCARIRSVRPRVCGADIGQIVDRRGSTCQALMVERAGLPSIRNRVAGRPYFVRTEAVEQLRLTVERANVWSEELVGGTGEEIAVQLLHVDGTVWRVLDGIHVDESAGVVRPAYQLPHVRDGSHGV